MKKLIVLAFFLSFSVGLKAQIEKPVKWSYAAKKISAVEAVVYMKATIDVPWHIYSAYQLHGGPTKTSFSFDKGSAYSLVGKIVEPKSISKFEEVFGMKVMYFEKSVVFSQRVRLRGKSAVVNGKVEFMACTDNQCLPPDELSFTIPIK
ncbi:protein-disulfide reductase DsbD domain-containing protein [Pedobacter helvus]|uniref:Protein-disulfide reductase DsbD domain-containing protein n=1 Tax=Pedobacter helvus TaxID=2563444 RepID=A0ABW9JCL8_9SPHI|nr:protein-disulfide reductase DsbD domain-containing protein [Pedobacter ureilyticus]